MSSGSRWIENGLILSFLAWLLTTILWGVFTAMKVPGPALDQVWLLITGVFIANIQAVVKQSKPEKEEQNNGNS